MRRFVARLVTLFRGRSAEHDLAREIDAHLALLQEDFEKQGLLPEDARLAARRAYGGVDQAKELHRETRSFLWIEHLLKDVSYGARNLLRTPGFTVIAVITLALGIGANTAIFSVVNAVLLQPLAYRDADRLVTLLHNGNGPVATANYLDWREQTSSFTAMAAADHWDPNLTSSDPGDNSAAEHLAGLKVTQNLLPMLGIDPMLGRLFRKGEDQIGADHEAVLSYTLWQRRFHGARDVLGKMITLDGEAYSIVGVMPPTFHFAPFWSTHAELWVPATLSDTLHQRGGNHLRVFARLKDGVTLAQARAEIATVTARLEKQYPATNRNVVVRPLKDNVVGNIRTPLFMMLGAVAFVLLIACANVAHMLLARTSDRQREIAVRAALGASKARLVAQFLTEHLLLAAIGAAAGLALAWAGIKALVALSPEYIPRVELVSLDTRVILFLGCVTVLTALAFGLTPALHAASGVLSNTLKEGGRGDTGGVQRNCLRRFLVASEFGLAFMLLMGAGLMVRSFYALQAVDTGFNPQHVLSMVISVAGTKEAEAGHRRMFYRDLLEKVKALPGVEAVGAINHLPLAGDLWDRGFEIEGRPHSRPGETPDAVYRIVMPGYFATMRLPLKRGRTITYHDNASTPPVVIINDKAARTFWPGEDPTGKRISIAAKSDGQPNWLTVIGVVANASLDDMVSPPFPEMYLAALQTPEFLGETADAIAPHMSYLTLVVRGSGDPADLTPALERTVRSFDRDLPISQVLTMEQAVAQSTAQPRFEMLLLGLFGTVALLLAAVGIYGVMNYSVARRTREIGIRMSLGAKRSDVLRMVVRQAVTQALIGMVAGIVGSFLLSNLISKLLFGVQPTDAWTFAGVTIALGMTALIATAFPARKAILIEPMTALRSE